MGPEPERMLWAEMMDRFGRRWALMDMIFHYGWRPNQNLLRICSVKYLAEHNLIKLSNQSDFELSCLFSTFAKCACLSVCLSV